MMNIFKNKFILTVITIIILAILAYAFLSSQSPSSSGDLVVSSNAGGIVGSDILTSLAEIQSLNLDTQIFTDINNLQLKDFSQDLPDNVPAGRTNPFAPLNFAKSSTSILPGGPQQFATTTGSAGVAKTIPSTSK